MKKQHWNVSLYKHIFEHSYFVMSGDPSSYDEYTSQTKGHNKNQGFKITIIGWVYLKVWMVKKNNTGHMVNFVLSALWLYRAWHGHIDDGVQFNHHVGVFYTYSTLKKG